MISYKGALPAQVSYHGQPVEVWRNGEKLWPPAVVLGFPQIQAATPSAFPALSATHPVALGSPTAGELLLVPVSFHNAVSLDTPAGWTRLFYASYPGQRAAALYARVATGGDALTLTNGEATTGTAAALRIRGWAGDLAKVALGAAFVSGGGTTSADTPPVTAPDGALKNLFLTMFGLAGDAAVMSTLPANYGEVIQVLRGGGVNNSASLAVASRELEAASDDPGPATPSENEGIISVAVVVQPGTAGLP